MNQRLKRDENAFCMGEIWQYSNVVHTFFNEKGKFIPNIKNTKAIVTEYFVIARYGNKWEKLDKIKEVFLGKDKLPVLTEIQI